MISKRHQVISIYDAMPAVHVRGIPDDLYERLKAAAAGNQRSLNGEILFRLQASFGPTPLPPDELLRDLDEFRAGLVMEPIDDGFLDWAKRQGRP